MESNKNTGLRNEQLNPCPEEPNCVCSQYPEDKSHHEEPWAYRDTQPKALNLVLEVLQAEDNATIVEHDEDYIHAEFKIPVFGFIDDVEFYIPEGREVIHYRSASRLGKWDFNVNKNRMKTLRDKLVKAGLNLL